MLTGISPMVPGAAITPADLKIVKSAKDFESLLLGSWLAQAEESFARLPGGDDEEDADAGKEQFQQIAMQSLGTALTEAGGIGLAKMIARHLRTADSSDVPPATPPPPGG